MGNYSRYKYVNTTFGGVGGLVVPNGTTAERDAAVALGTVRYNTDLGLLEQYNALGWQSVDAPPAVTNISGTINENTNSTLTITGSNFKTGGIVSVEGAAVNGIPRSLSTTFVSQSTLTASTNATAVNYVGGATFDIKVVNPSGLSGILSPAGTVDRDPVWSTAAGTYTVFDSGRGVTLPFTAADPDPSQTVTISLLSGSLPAGATLNTSTGGISGFSAVGSDTSSTFTLRATSSFQSQTADRTFTILVRAPVVQSFTTAGTGTFSVPTGVSSVRVLVIGGGGSGGTRNGGAAPGQGTDGGGGGGAGGYVEVSSFPVTPGGSIPYQVGGGAPATRSANVQTPGIQGTPSIFGSITAIGGGFGGCGPGGPVAYGGPGGSGGGGGGGGAPPAAPGGSALQPLAAGVSGSSGFGFRGGNNSQSAPYSGSGGGGAGGVGADGGSGRVAPGGGGRASNITGSSITRAGGGAGGGGGPSNVVGGQGGSGGGGRGGGAGPFGYPSGDGEAGANNTGGGGGGGAGSPAGQNGYGGFGGPGVIIIRY